MPVFHRLSLAHATVSGTGTRMPGPMTPSHEMRAARARASLHLASIWQCTQAERTRQSDEDGCPRECAKYTIPSAPPQRERAPRASGQCIIFHLAAGRATRQCDRFPWAMMPRTPSSPNPFTAHRHGSEQCVFIAQLPIRAVALHEYHSRQTQPSQPRAGLCKVAAPQPSPKDQPPWRPAGSGKDG